MAIQLDHMMARVAGKADQTPEYNPLRNSGHESGDFVFVRKQAAKNYRIPTQRCLTRKSLYFLI
jgi:hypothetical protein